MFAFTGCLCMLIDPKAARANGEKASIFAASVDIFSAVFGAIYFILSARNVKTIPICFLIWIMNLHTWFINSCIAKIDSPQTVEIFSFNVEHGCLGFLDWRNQGTKAILLYAVFGSFFGSAGYTLTLLFFSPLVSSSAYLVEPLVAQAMGYYCGLDLMPGWPTIIGAVLAIFGILFIDRGSRERIKKEDAEADNKYRKEEDLLGESQYSLTSSFSSGYKGSYSDFNQSNLSGR